MITTQELKTIFAEKLLKTGSFDEALTKAVWIAYKQGIADAQKQRLAHVSIQTNDMVSSVKFYEALGFVEHISESTQFTDAYLTNGNDVLALHYTTQAPRIDHFGLIVQADSQLLKDKELETHRDGSKGYYVTTPEGLSLEIITMPTMETN